MHTIGGRLSIPPNAFVQVYICNVCINLTAVYNEYFKKHTTRGQMYQHFRPGLTLGQGLSHRYKPVLRLGLALNVDASGPRSLPLCSQAIAPESFVYLYPGFIVHTCTWKRKSLSETYIQHGCPFLPKLVFRHCG